jgi:multidrug efflux pump subunit AcrA (membrane-fusion protein)
MKRSDFFIRLMTAVLFLAVASYAGVSIYNSVINTFETTLAISYAIEESFPAYGYIVRSETVLTGAGDAVMPTVREGERVASGQTVAVEYLSREALETASQLRALNLRIARLEAPGASADATRLDSVIALSNAVHSGDLSRLDELSLSIETYIFTGNSAPEAELSVLQAQLSALERRSAGVRTISAPVSGFFSQVVDGFEHIGPGALSELSPTGLTELFVSPSGVYGAGKLVTGFKWYYAAVMDAGEAARLPIGRQITLQFSGVFSAGVTMLVESVGRRDEGRCVVVFSSDRSIHDVVSLRSLRADIVYDVISGIRVPKEAIHLDDNGTTHIFLQTGVRAERVNVDILLVSGDSYLVRDGAETGTPLRAGATIIVRANNLYHGKIVA